MSKRMPDRVPIGGSVFFTENGVVVRYIVIGSVGYECRVRGAMQHFWLQTEAGALVERHVILSETVETATTEIELPIPYRRKEPYIVLACEMLRVYGQSRNAVVCVLPLTPSVLKELVTKIQVCAAAKQQDSSVMHTRYFSLHFKCYYGEQIVIPGLPDYGAAGARSDFHRWAQPAGIYGVTDTAVPGTQYNMCVTCDSLWFTAVVGTSRYETPTFSLSELQAFYPSLNMSATNDAADGKQRVIIVD